jgi:hypothetical protein
MHWADRGSEGFVITKDEEIMLLVLDASDMVLLAGACLDGDVEIWEDEGELMVDGEHDHVRLELARDLLIAATVRQAIGVSVH